MIFLNRYLGEEREVAPWSVASGSLGYFENVFYYTEVYPNVVAYEKELIDALYLELGWDVRSIKMRISNIYTPCPFICNALG